MDRSLEPELLDELPPQDPSAAASRRDLRRVNSWMGNSRFMAEALGSAFAKQRPRKIMEIGAGDGTFLLKVAKRLAWKAPGPAAIMLDRRNIVSQETCAAFEKLGWPVETMTSDVFEGLWQSNDAAYDAIIANLFLHHFSDGRLAELFELARRKTRLVIAVEPRRGALSMVGCRLLWAIGCNHVTRHDAVVSVRAGFKEKELSKLWGRQKDWVCEERPAGFSSHLFVAKQNRSA